MIIDAFRSFTERYSETTQHSFAYDEVTKVITTQLPNIFATRIDKRDEYIIRGSVGQGNWVEIPWIAFMDKKVTTSTQSGYYVCYLINPIKNFMYLGLAVGWTQFAEESSTKAARQHIREYSEYLQEQLDAVPAGFRTGVIDLEANGKLAKGYEQGQIVSKRYDLRTTDDEELVGDLQELLLTYKDLTELVGNDIKNIGHDRVLAKEKISDLERTINRFTLQLDPAKALEEAKSYVNQMHPDKRDFVASKVIRNPKIALLIKEGNQYVCELCGRKPFMQKNGKPYAEADHIKPLGKEGYDSPDNMRCLCAQCHAVVTHGSDEEIEGLYKR